MAELARVCKTRTFPLCATVENASGSSVANVVLVLTIVADDADGGVRLDTGPIEDAGKVDVSGSYEATFTGGTFDPDFVDTSLLVIVDRAGRHGSTTTCQYDIPKCVTIVVGLAGDVTLTRDHAAEAREDEKRPWLNNL